MGGRISETWDYEMLHDGMSTVRIALESIRYIVLFNEAFIHTTNTTVLSMIMIPGSRMVIMK